MWSDLQQTARELWAHPLIRSAIVLAGTIIGAYLARFLVSRTLLKLAERTKNDLDDQIIGALKRPIFLSVILLGLASVLGDLVADSLPRFAAHGVLRTLAVLVWMAAALEIGTAILGALSARTERRTMVQPRTLPLFEILLKVLIVSAAVYFVFLAWDIDLTAWIASAGIIGIAVGFAAKDSLANLISGIFIVADAPYKVGDWVVLDSELRGMVRSIGVRSTRILTRDDVEITVPNSLMGESKIVNEAGGPDVKQRIAAQVSVAYTSDVDHVVEVLLSCVEGVDGICPSPAPDYRFRSFGASGLDFDLLVWIDRPAIRGKIISDLNMRIFKRFHEAGIEIPYSKHDVFIKQMPPLEHETPAGESEPQRPGAPRGAAA
ncbi:mechanosensitive ion channel family protein [Haliangium ochraceum]|uniref:MscS Mechanosensitive ion channel n=1 Tax=Haliangium ochraceum (strain DSM 14365 / JCM 11303 / SMP-2) TaxID=502025 RepID=D0LXL3_HALO1|nr:mechanosensitive ion channel domain-containing protein [Haliangium ochraceum]ACY17768.1 MscS Mechanosensitive ion channel [Haliangium ochraceum DSM 14365]